MEIENDKPKINIFIDGKKEEFPLLKDIQYKCQSFIKDIRDKKTKTLKDFQEIIYNIETSSEFNYYFLRFLKENNLSYIEDGVTWNYENNLKLLKETLDDNYFYSLEKEERPNPLQEISNILKDYILVYENQEEINSDEYTYEKLLQKYQLNFEKLNFPLITGIERLRVKYYKDLLIENDISTNCGLMKNYIMNMEKDKDIFGNSLNDNKFNLKTYLLILTLTTTFKIDNEEIICNFFSKNILKDDYTKKYNFIKPLEDNMYEVTTKYETRKINGKYYILSGLNKEIGLYPSLPIDFLLMRNESFEKFEEDGGKGFIKNIGLYDSFMNYIKFFIKSNAIQQLLQENECYKNIAILLNNENFIDEMLDEEHFRFIPLYGTKNTYGYTNKDLMIACINSIPEISENIRITNVKTKIENIYNCCLLFSIGVKFVTSLHEFIIHLAYAYLHYFSNKKLDSNSFKEPIDNGDGGFFFERQLNLGKKFEFLDINSIVTLLDGVSCQKNLSEFQEDLNKSIKISELKERYKEGKINGFLGEFLQKYPINFDYFNEKKKNKPTVSCRGYDGGVGISMIRFGPDSYGGGRAKKKNN